jgi:hypothetical protein
MTGVMLQWRTLGRNVPSRGGKFAVRRLNVQQAMGPATNEHGM